MVMNDGFLIPFDEGTDVLVHEPSFIEPVRPPSLPRQTNPEFVMPPAESIAAPETTPTPVPQKRSLDLLSLLLGPAVALLTALVVYRLFF